MTTSPQNQEEQAQPTPADVKQSVKPETKQKEEAGKTIRKAVAKQNQREWGFFGARAFSKACEYGGETLELKMLRRKLREQSEILDEFALTPEELAAMTSD